MQLSAPTTPPVGDVKRTDTSGWPCTIARSDTHPTGRPEHFVAPSGEALRERHDGVHVAHARRRRHEHPVVAAYRAPGSNPRPHGAREPGCGGWGRERGCFEAKWPSQRESSGRRRPRRQQPRPRRTSTTPAVPEGSPQLSGPVPDRRLNRSGESVRIQRPAAQRYKSRNCYGGGRVEDACLRPSSNTGGQLTGALNSLGWLSSCIFFPHLPVDFFNSAGGQSLHHIVIGTYYSAIPLGGDQVIIHQIGSPVSCRRGKDALGCSYGQRCQIDSLIRHRNHQCRNTRRGRSESKETQARVGPERQLTAGGICQFYYKCFTVFWSGS